MQYNINWFAFAVRLVLYYKIRAMLLPKMISALSPNTNGELVFSSNANGRFEEFTIPIREQRFLFYQLKRT